MRKLIIGLGLIVVAYQVATRTDLFSSHESLSTPLVESAIVGSGDALSQAYAKQLHGVQVEGRGVVIKMLKDDNDGSRHQRFIVRVPSGQTILIAHNVKRHMVWGLKPCVVLQRVYINIAIMRA